MLNDSETSSSWDKYAIDQSSAEDPFFLESQGVELFNYQHYQQIPTPVGSVGIGSVGKCWHLTGLQIFIFNTFNIS